MVFLPSYFLIIYPPDCYARASSFSTPDLHAASYDLEYDASHGLSFPGCLRAALGVDIATLSFIVTARSFVGMFAPFLGSIADHRGRKSGMLLGIFLFIAGMSLLSRSIRHLLHSALPYCLESSANIFLIHPCKPILATAFPTHGAALPSP